MKCHVTRAPFASGPLVDSNQNFVIVAGSTKAPKTWAIGPRISCEAVAVSSVSFIAGSHVRALTQRIDLYRCTSHANTTNRMMDVSTLKFALDDIARVIQNDPGVPPN